MKNAYLGFGRKYKLLLVLCDEFCKDYKTRVDVDRTIHSLLRYQTLRRDLSLFVCRNYKVRDITLAEPDQSFARSASVSIRIPAARRSASVRSLSRTRSTTEALRPAPVANA